MARNFYDPPYQNMIDSGTFWRCPHGHTRFRGEFWGCFKCALRRPRRAFKRDVMGALRRMWQK